MFIRLRVISVIFFCLFAANILAQENNQTTSDFYIGGIVSYSHSGNQTLYDTYQNSGMNTIVVCTADSNQSRLTGYNLIPYNQLSVDWIHYYATGLYNKWEAEESQVDSESVGIKHRGGGTINYLGKECWYSAGLTDTVELMYGPHYRQLRRYRRFLSGQPYIDYIVRFNMALDKGDYTDDEEVCRITIRVTQNLYINGIYQHKTPVDTLVLPVTLKVSDFNTDTLGHFKEFLLTYNYNSYPPRSDPNTTSIIQNEDTVITYSDSSPHNGIEFVVEWLGKEGMTLYIDNAEVYDNNGWDQYVNPTTRDSVISRIRDFAQSFPSWLNIKYWYANDEPYSRDAFIPMHTVDEILTDTDPNAPPIISHYYAGGQVNKENLLAVYNQIAQPHKLLIDLYPFHPDYPVIRPEAIDSLKVRFQEASTLDPDFYYTPQAFGNWKYENGGHWETWRLPDTSEFKVPIMLALAHGAKGLIFSDYDSYEDGDRTYMHTCIVGPYPDYDTVATGLWSVIKNNLAPRLTGRLGNRLMDLIYTGDYISAQYIVPTYNPNPQTLDYLTIPAIPSTHTMNWHAGLFYRDEYSDDKYFFLANLLTNVDKSVPIKLTPPVGGFTNYRFRNYEGGFDTTFTGSEFTYMLFHQAGEGYLYEVAPVIKYGGKLLYDELTGDGITLTDDMIIDNGAELSVYEDYYADGNIIIKNGSIINQEGGIIHFRDGKKLIIEGNASIHGTSQYKLTFDFDTPDGSNGIIINSGGSLNMTYCLIKNAGTGIDAETNYNASSGTLNIQYVDFENCSNSCISIQGQAAGDQIPSLPPPVIKYCNMSLSGYGVWVSNLAQVLIRENHITNTDMGVFLSNVSAPQVIGNTIQTSTYQLPGIFLESSNGLVRSNVISGHTNGIQLGNSSPDLGGNIIEDNLNRGLYVGTGSLPDMQGRLASDPEHPNLWYAVSGYNKISNNGGWSLDDDGSEIFINNADVIMKGGCNEITDQRIPNANESNHLYNTKLLMNCSGSIVQPEVHAELNFWDEHPIYPLEERFGDCNIYFDPVTDPCPLPLGGGDRLLITSSSGEVVDTLYAEQRTVGILSPTETAYAAAEEKFLTADYQGAEAIYNGIINSEDSVNAKLFAYRRLFETGRLLRKDESYFSDLRDSYLSLAGAMNDSVRAKVFNHLSTLSLVAREDYIPAIGEFDEIIQQNPNSEAAVYAEIDAVTASLLLEGGDTTLSKSRLGKYLAKPGSNYFTRMDEIIRKNFGSGMEAESEKLIPTEYSLYNNYPNPFNPTTTIRFDIPERTNVELVVYDILGRRVKSLISDEVRNPGRYEISFNGSSLASGVYIYKITTKNYSQARKMLLIK